MKGHFGQSAGPLTQALLRACHRLSVSYHCWRVPPSASRPSSASAWCFALLGAVSACAMTPDRLTPVHRGYYGLLESSGEQRAFLRMDDQERDAHARRMGFYKAWTGLPEWQRHAALQGKVEPGCLRFAVHMAWGAPADDRWLRARGRELLLETYILCTSGPRAGQHVRAHKECDGTSSETQVIFEQGRVIELVDLD